jgi:hypothetical protein
LPPAIRNYVNALSDQTQTPIAMASMLVLSVLAACLQKKFEVSPYADQYKEPVSIWSLVAAPPASRKTAVLQGLLEPILDWEQQETTRLGPEIDRANIQRKVSIQRIQALTKEASKADDAEVSVQGEQSRKTRQQLEDEILELQESLPPEVVLPRLFVTDTTPEAMQNHLAQHEGRGAVLTDEGNLFEILSGMYSDGKSNLDAFLQGHSAGTLRVTRQGRAVFLNNIAISLGLTVQPQVLSDLNHGSKQSFRGRGLLARFLFCLPKSNIGKREISKRLSIPLEVNRNYRASIMKLLDFDSERDVHGNIIPKSLCLEVEALNIWEAFSQWLELEQGEGGKFEHIQDWTGKLPGQVLRIAALCHVAGQLDANISSLQIGKDTIASVLELAKNLVFHAQAALALMSNEQGLNDAEYILRWLTNHSECDEQGAYFFRRNELHKNSRFNKSKVDRLTKALSILTERHIVSPLCKLPTRKPTLIHYVNPVILKDNLGLPGDNGDKGDKAA